MVEREQASERAGACRGVSQVSHSPAAGVKCRDCARTPASRCPVHGPAALGFSSRAAFLAFRSAVNTVARATPARGTAFPVSEVSRREGIVAFFLCRGSECRVGVDQRGEERRCETRARTASGRAKRRFCAVLCCPRITSDVRECVYPRRPPVARLTRARPPLCHVGLTGLRARMPLARG